MINKIFDWMFSARYDETTVSDWLAGLVLILIIAFMWSVVVNHTIKEIV